MTLIAKPLINDQVWILTNGQDKVGNVISTDNGYTVQIGNQLTYYDSTTNIEKSIPIEFEKIKKTKSTYIPYAVWPTTGKTYNNVFDVKRKMHIYTKSPNSKCYFAAGWFKIKTSDTWSIEFCPKYIFIQRYEYLGPFISEKEAKEG